MYRQASIRYDKANNRYHLTLDSEGLQDLGWDPGTAVNVTYLNDRINVMCEKVSKKK